jgi:hypothetical protein
LSGSNRVMRFVYLDNKSVLKQEVQIGTYLVAEPMQINAMDKKMIEITNLISLLPPVRPRVFSWMNSLVCKHTALNHSARAIKNYQKTLKKIQQLKKNLIGTVAKMEKMASKTRRRGESANRAKAIVQYREGELNFMR